jgi:hypothetical protein
MNKNDGNYRRFGLALAFTLAALILLPGLPARAAELTVADYVDLTIARLELAVRTWSEERRSPVETEEAALFEAKGTTAKVYFHFAGEHGKEIEGYLEENTDKRDRIAALSQEVQRLIEQAEVTQ